jgi:hypothetical protein
MEVSQSSKLTGVHVGNLNISQIQEEPGSRISIASVERVPDAQSYRDKGNGDLRSDRSCLLLRFFRVHRRCRVETCCHEGVGDCAIQVFFLFTCTICRVLYERSARYETSVCPLEV